MNNLKAERTLTAENRVSDERLTLIASGIADRLGVGASGAPDLERDIASAITELLALRSQSLSTQQPMGEVREEMVERGLQQYSEGGCMGLSHEERREVVASILYAALHPNQESGE